MTLSMFCFRALCDIRAGGRTAVSEVWLGLSVDLWQEIAGSALSTRSENHWVKQLGALEPALRLDSSCSEAAAGTRQLHSTDSWDTASGLAHSSQSRSNYQVKTTYNVTLTAVQASPNATDTHYMNCSLWSTILGHRVTVLYRRGVSVTPVTGRYLGSGHFTGWWGGGEQVMNSNADTGQGQHMILTTTGWHIVTACPMVWLGLLVTAGPSLPAKCPGLGPAARPVKMHYWRLNQFEIGTAAGCHQNQRHARWRALTSPRAATKITDFPEVPDKFQRSKLSPSQFSLTHRDGVGGGLVAVREGRRDRLGSHRL